jgi:hypothetical protein
VRKLLIAAAGAAVLAAASPAAAVTLVYNDFTSTSGLQLNGNAGAATDDSMRRVLRVTPSTFNQSGSVFSTNAIALSSDYSFSTRFTFNFNHQGGIEGADGLVFVIQPNSNTTGGFGGGIGYAGIGNSLGVEFDNFNNGDIDGNSNNHAGVDLNGDINSAYRNTSLPFVLDSAQDLTAWIDYNGAAQNLQVRLNNTNVRATSTVIFDISGINLANVINPGGGGSNAAFVGFTSGTGSGFANHDVINWEFRDAFAPIDAVPEPGAWALMIGGFGLAGAMLRRRRAAVVAP